MREERMFPSWRERIEFKVDGPGHVDLFESPGFKAVLVGMEAGQKIPPHPAQSASYHILEGTGTMMVEDREVALTQGATVVVPEHMPRGIVADTRLAILASHGASQPGAESQRSKMPPVRTMIITMIGAMAAMAGLMVVFGRMFADIVPMLNIMSSGGSGAGLWGLMIVPAVGMLLMFGLMWLFYRRMSRSTAHTPAGHSQMHSGRDSTSTSPEKERISELMIPAVSCPHCKMKIENRVGALAGVRSARVDVESRTAVFAYVPPASEEVIRCSLEEIGYPAD